MSDRRKRPMDCRQVAAAAFSVPLSVVVSPLSAGWISAGTRAPGSRSTACSGVAPSMRGNVAHPGYLPSRSAPADPAPSRKPANPSHSHGVRAGPLCQRTVRHEADPVAGALHLAPRPIVHARHGRLEMRLTKAGCRSSGCFRSAAHCRSQERSECRSCTSEIGKPLTFNGTQDYHRPTALFAIR